MVDTYSWVHLLIHSAHKSQGPTMFQALFLFTQTSLIFALRGL